MTKMTISSGSRIGTKILEEKTVDELKHNETQTKFNLDLSHTSESMKPVPKELLTKFLKLEFERIAKQLNVDFNSMTLSNDIKLITIFTKNEQEGNKILDIMSYKIANDFGNFIEHETGESKKKFYRTLTLFESVVENNRVTITWA